MRSSSGSARAWAKGAPRGELHRKRRRGHGQGRPRATSSGVVASSSGGRGGRGKWRGDEVDDAEGTGIRGGGSAEGGGGPTVESVRQGRDRERDVEERGTE